MRIEPYGIDSILHITKRGARGTPITRSKTDRDRFARLLFYLNDDYQDRGGYGWEEEIRTLRPFERPSTWPVRSPLVRVLAWTLMPNHFHLILQEIQEGGVSKFMQRLGGSMSKHFNVKHGGQGSIFESAFKARTIDTDEYLRYCAPYVMVKNPFELAPGGLVQSAKHFDEAWKWALSYPHSSLPHYGAGIASPIIALEDNILSEMFPTPQDFKRAAKDMFLAHAKQREEFENLLLEEW